MKRILVGVDGSKESREAANFAAELAQATKSELVLASVVFIPVGLGAPELLAQVDRWEKDEQANSEKTVKEIAASISRPGVRVETLTPKGSPAEKLADLAQSGDVELVVVGHRGRGAIKRLLLGSVADRLVQICPKPVLIVR
jgi:nucleotide-binding universal stress UspA family protein